MKPVYQTNLPIHTPASAPVRGSHLLEDTQTKLGFIPNMYGAMINSPGLLETYQLGYERFRSDSGFSPAEQEVVFLTISFENGCDYCMAAHSTLADNFSKVPKEATDAVREGREIPDSKFHALARFVRHLLQTRGRPTEAEAQKFFSVGFSEQQVFDLILAIAVKTMSNYSNHIMNTSVDNVFKDRLWTPPA